MHELSITKNLFDLLVSECNEKNISSAKKIILELGELTTFKADPILFYFDQFKKEYSFLKDAILDIITIKGRMKCNSCNKISEIEENYMVFCPLCDSSDVEIMDGKEFKLVEIKY